MYSLFDEEERWINGQSNNLHRRFQHENFRKENIIKETLSAKRRNEKEPDPELLEKYDNFYHTTKSLLVLFQIMGVMPIERAGKGKTTYRWVSPAAIWAYTIYCAETAYVGVVFKERLSLITQGGKRFDEYIYGIIFLSIMIPHFLLPVGAWTNGSEVAIFKNMWTRFQLKYFEVTGTPIIFHNLTLITYSLCVVSWLSSILIMMAQFYLQPDMLLWHTFAYFHILAMLNGLCSLWFINCTAMGRVAEWLSQRVDDALKLPNSSVLLAEYRDLWVDLSHMMQQLGKAYCGMYGLYCILILLTTIVATYGVLTEILDHGISLKETGLLLIAFYCLVLLYIICNEAHHASRKMGTVFKDCLLNVHFTSLDLKTREEVNMFLTAIDKNPPIMNLNGFANINRELLTSTMTSMATYLLMLMQFRLSLMRNAAIAARRAAITSKNATMS